MSLLDEEEDEVAIDTVSPEGCNGRCSSCTYECGSAECIVFRDTRTEVSETED